MSDEIKVEQITVPKALFYLVDGLKIALSPKCRAYVVIPIIVNILLLILLGYGTFTYLKALVFELFDMFPAFLVFFAYVICALLGLTIFCVACYCFSTIATIIASPFYGLLADKVESEINGTHGDDMGVVDIIKDIPRILLRECKKQMFFLPLAFICLMITIIPFLNFLSPFLWFALTSWMGCLQYVDYAYDNHKITFTMMQKDLRNNMLPTFTIGASIAVCVCVPVLNILIPPAAVCAGTKYFVELQKRYQITKG